MSISRKLMTVGGGDPTYVEDVFSTYVYSGTGVSQDIVNGVDLGDKGGLVWIKNRNNGIATGRDHVLFDDATSEGGQRYLSSSKVSTLSSSGNRSPSPIVYNSEGFTLGTDIDQRTNLADDSDGNKFVSWSFAKQEGFFDVVQYTGNYIAGREIPHNLGSVPGMIIVKCLNQQTPWVVYHKSLGPTKAMDLNEDDQAYTDSTIWNNTAPTDTHFTVGNGSEVNQHDYVAYVFADDAPVFGPKGDQSVIKCGSYTGTGAAGNEIDLGWEPQWVMIKESTYGSDWFMVDTMRGWGSTPNDRVIRADEQHTEKDFNTELTSADFGAPTPTGFVVGATHGGVNLNGNNYIYMAIRRPMKPASEFEPEELFATGGHQGSNPDYVSGFPVDMAWRRNYAAGGGQTHVGSRLIQGYELYADSYSTKTPNTRFYFDYMDGWHNQEGWGGTGPMSCMFKRAPGFFDVVTYEGNGVVGREVPHNLKAVPEMMWIKALTESVSWPVYSKDLEASEALYLNSDVARETDPFWNNTRPTAEGLFLDGNRRVNSGSNTYIAFLWASVPGLCSIGSYVADYTERTIDCGFTNGARFVLIKRVDAGGDWMYWDTFRGITPAGTPSPSLTLNKTDAQHEGDGLHPAPEGFTLQEWNGDNNSAGGEYIYMAIA